MRNISFALTTNQILEGTKTVTRRLGWLHLSQSAYNGHVHGKCETDDCVSWME
jgi:hypothetical protein